MIKNLLIACCGIVLLLAGITLVLKEWAAVVTVFNGVIGGALAVAGLIILSLTKRSR